MTVLDLLKRRTQDPARALWRAGSALLVLVVVLMATFPVRSDDLFMYLALGRAFFRDGRFPDTDPFLFSMPGTRWNVLHEWASHLGAWALYRAGGFNLLIAAKALWLAATAALPVLLARRLGYRSPVIWLLALAAVFASADRFIERTSLLSDGLTALTLAIVLAERKAPGRARWALPPLFLVWVNLHPGFMTGLGVVGLSVLSGVRAWRERPQRTMALSFGASVAACLANPGGLSGALYPLNAFFNPGWAVFKRHYFEWMPTLSDAYATSTGVLSFLALAAGVAALVLTAWAHGRRPVYETLVFLFLAWQGTSAIRFVPLAAFSMAVLGASLAAQAGWLSLDARESARAAKRRERGEAPDPRARAFALGALALAATAALAVKVALFGYTPLSGHRSLGLGLEERAYPIRTAEAIEALDLKVNLFNQHEFGAYLAYRWDGRRKLYYHGFVDDPAFYEKSYYAVNQSPAEFDRIVRDASIGAFLLSNIPASRTSGPLLYRMLLSRPDWRLTFVDDVSMLFLRDLPENREAMERWQRSRAAGPGSH